MTAAAYVFIAVGMVVIKGQHDKAARLRRQRDAAVRALTRLGGRDAETPAQDEMELMS